MDAAVPNAETLRLLAIVGAFDDVEYVKHIVTTVTTGILHWSQYVESKELIDDFFATFDSQCSISTDTDGLGPFCEVFHSTPEVEVTLLVNPTCFIVKNEIVRLLMLPSKSRLVVYGGHSIDSKADWCLQDGIYSVQDLHLVLSDPKVATALSRPGETIELTISCNKAALWNNSKELTEKSSLELKFFDPFNNKMTDTLSQNLNGGSPGQASSAGKGLNKFGEYLEDVIGDQVDNIFTQLHPPPQVGYLKIRKPCMYIFPAGTGDSMFMAVNGFNILINGGSLSSPWFWRLTSHLETVDCMIATHLGSDCLTGLNSFLLRKLQEKQLRLPMDNTTDEYKKMESCLISPNLGSFYMNIPEKFAETALRKNSNEADELNGVNSESVAQHLNIKTTSVVQDTLRLSKGLGLNILPLTRNQVPEPITVYYKVWLGKLDIYVISPEVGSAELKYIKEKWGCNGKTSETGKTGVTLGSKSESEALLSDLASICCLLVWHPASPTERIIRVLFPGNASQDKIFQGLEKMKDCAFLSMPSPTEALLTKQKAAQSPVKPPRSAQTSAKPGIQSKVHTNTLNSKATSHTSSRTTAPGSATAKTTSGSHSSSAKSIKNTTTAPKKTLPAKKPTKAPDTGATRAKREAATGFVKPAGKRTKPEKPASSESAAKTKSAVGKPKPGPVHAKAEARVHAKQTTSKIAASKSSDTKSKLATKPAAKVSSRTTPVKAPKKLDAPVSIKGRVSPSKDKIAKEAKKKEDAKQKAAKPLEPPLTPPEDLTDAFSKLKEEKQPEKVSEGQNLPKRPSPEGQDGVHDGQFVDVAHVSVDVTVDKQANFNEVTIEKKEPTESVGLPDEKAANVAEYLNVHDDRYGEKDVDQKEPKLEHSDVSGIKLEEEDTKATEISQDKVDNLSTENLPKEEEDIPVEKHEHETSDISQAGVIAAEVHGETVVEGHPATPEVAKEEEPKESAELAAKENVGDDFEIINYESRSLSNNQEGDLIQQPGSLAENVPVKDAVETHGNGDLEVVDDSENKEVSAETLEAEEVQKIEDKETTSPTEENYKFDENYFQQEDAPITGDKESDLAGGDVDAQLSSQTEDKKEDVAQDVEDDEAASKQEELSTENQFHTELSHEEEAKDYFHQVTEEDHVNLCDDHSTDLADVQTKHEQLEQSEQYEKHPEPEDSFSALESESVSGVPSMSTHQPEEAEKQHDMGKEYLDVETHDEVGKDDFASEAASYSIPDEQKALEERHLDIKPSESENIVDQSLSPVECARDCENQSVTFDANTPVVIPEIKQSSYEVYDEDYYPDDDEEDESNGRYDDKEWHPTPYPSDPQSMITDTSPTSDLGSYEAQGTDTGMSDVIDNAAHHLDLQRNDNNKTGRDDAMSDTPISSGLSTPTEHADNIDDNDIRNRGDIVNFLDVEQDIMDKSLEKEELAPTDGDFGLSSSSASKQAVIESPISTADLDSAYNIPSMGGSISAGVTTEAEELKSSDLLPESHALSSIPDFQSLVLPDDQEQPSIPISQLDDNGNESQVVDESDGWKREMKGLAGKYQDSAPVSAWSEGKDAEEEEVKEENVEETPREVPETADQVKSSPLPPSDLEEQWATRVPDINFDQFDQDMGSLHANDNPPTNEASEADKEYLGSNFDRAPIMSISDSMFDQLMTGDEASMQSGQKSPDVSPSIGTQSSRPEEDLLVDVADHGMQDLHSSTDRPEVDQATSGFHSNPFACEFTANELREGEVDFDEDFIPVRKEDPMMAQDKSRPVKVTKRNTSAATKKVDSHPFYMDLTYIPHHGNKNFVNVDFFKRLRAKYYVVSGMDASNDEPNVEVLDALLEGKKSWEIPSASVPGQDGMNVTVIPTHNSPALVQWYDKQHREMQAENIHLVASGSKVMMHDETMEACKIEF
uniref:Histone H3.3-like n=1 Tax=Phallusia mammillata TaxID=59560 RepID=A0A6F9DF13_9ASCI|nr:histone H3.3-like [Phallusia mammillata]